MHVSEFIVRVLCLHEDSVRFVIGGSFMCCKSGTCFYRVATPSDQEDFFVRTCKAQLAQNVPARAYFFQGGFCDCSDS